MADTTVAQEVLLGEETVFKFKRSDQTDYSILQDVIDEDIVFTPIGGETKERTALSGKSVEIKSKINFVESNVTMWLGTSDIEVFRAAFGEPTVTGSGPYTHTFSLDNLSQDCDIYLEGPSNSNSANKIIITGSSATVKFNELGIVKGDLSRYSVNIKVSNSNFTPKIVYSSDLS